VRVDLGGSEVLVPQQLLDDTQVGAAVEQVRRERVAERMGRDADRETGSRAQAVEPVAQAAHAERPSEVVQEDLDRRGVGVGVGGGCAPALEKHRPAILEIGRQRGARRSAEESDPLFSALAEDPDLPTPQVERGQVR
jgi:hypothetical protein